LSHGAFRIGGVTSSRDREIFVRLPAMIHRHDERWVPPLSADEIRFLDPCRNHAFTYSDVMPAVAWRGDRPLGRIVGIVNHRHNALGNAHTARFGSLECENDSGAVQALLGYVEDWARQRGMRRVVGPMGFTDQDPEGLLVDGLEFIDSHHMLESNLAVRSEMERLGGQIYKRFRIYRKVPAPA